MGAFHLGFAEALHRSGAKRTHCIEIAGASAGALVSAVLATDTPLHAARIVLRDLASQARGAGPLGILTPGFSLVENVASALDAHLPSDAAQRASEARLFVALTSAVTGKTRYVSSWSTRDEFIDCVRASCDIPGVTGLLRASSVPRAAGIKASPTTAHHDELLALEQRTLLQRVLNRNDVDGGLFDLHPDPWRVDAAGSATDASEEVHFVSPFSGSGLAVAPPRSSSGALSLPLGYGRTVDASAANFARAVHALRPPSDSVLASYEAEGFASAESFFKSIARAVRPDSCLHFD